MKKLAWFAFAVFVAAALKVDSSGKGRVPTGTDTGSPIARVGTLTGTVTAPKVFKAAKVYARNVEKNVIYMVYTSGGHYRFVDLFPGTYEVRVDKNGFSSEDIKKVPVAADGSATANFALQNGSYIPNEQISSNIQKLRQCSPTIRFILRDRDGRSRRIVCLSRSGLAFHAPIQRRPVEYGD